MTFLSAELYTHSNIISPPYMGTHSSTKVVFISVNIYFNQNNSVANKLYNKGLSWLKMLCHEKRQPKYVVSTAIKLCPSACICTCISFLINQSLNSTLICKPYKILHFYKARQIIACISQNLICFKIYKEM